MKFKLFSTIFAGLFLLTFIFISCQREEINLTQSNNKEKNSVPRSELLNATSISCESCDNLNVTYELKEIRDGFCYYEVHVSTNTESEFCGQGYVLNAKPFPLSGNPQTIYVSVGSDPVRLEFTAIDQSTGERVTCFTKLFQPCSSCESFDCSLVSMQYKKLDVRSLNNCCIYQFNVSNQGPVSVFVNNFGKIQVSPIEIESYSSKRFLVEVCEGDNVRITVGPNREYCHHECQEATLTCSGKK